MAWTQSLDRGACLLLFTLVYYCLLLFTTLVYYCLLLLFTSVYSCLQVREVRVPHALHGHGAVPGVHGVPGGELHAEAGQVPGVGGGVGGGGESAPAGAAGVPLLRGGAQDRGAGAGMQGAAARNLADIRSPLFPPSPSAAPRVRTGDNAIPQTPRSPHGLFVPPLGLHLPPLSATPQQAAPSLPARLPPPAPPAAPLAREGGHSAPLPADAAVPTLLGASQRRSAQEDQRSPPLALDS